MSTKKKGPSQATVDLINRKYDALNELIDFRPTIGGEEITADWPPELLVKAITNFCLLPEIHRICREKGEQP